MKESYEGKTLKNEQGIEYIVLKELNYKSIPCVYAMQVMPNDEEGEKQLFQITEEGILIDIKSKKILKNLSEMMFREQAKNEKPRKIREDESIESYLAYLDEYYKTKIVTII